MGDLNLTPWSPLFGQFTSSAKLQRAKQGLGIQPTWYARGSLFPFGLVLDHVLIDSSLTCVDVHIGPLTGSDHRSVLAVISKRENTKPPGGSD